jgi:hypothetical protein
MATRGASGPVTAALPLIAALPGQVVHPPGDRRIRLAAQRTETGGVVDGMLAAGLSLSLAEAQQRFVSGRSAAPVRECWMPKPPARLLS